MSEMVPKVHPLDRAVEQDDPMELVATPAQGDPDFMLDCVLQEFIWMGCDAEALMSLFYSPEYPVLNQLLACFGAEDVHRRIESLLARSGGLRFQETIAADPEPAEEHEPELIQLSTERIGERGGVKW